VNSGSQTEKGMTVVLTHPESTFSDALISAAKPLVWPTHSQLLLW